MNRWLLLLGASCVGLSGCVSMAPPYSRPDAPVAADFGNAGQVDSEAVTMARLEWREVFLDPGLQSVIALALDNNRDLRVALLNIEKSGAQYRIQRADLLPTVAANAGYSAARTAVSGNGKAPTQIVRSASAEAGFSSWELDLFGRVRSMQDKALQTWLATEQTQRSTRLSLIAEVAGDWLTVAAYQQRLAVAQATLESQQRSLALVQLRHDQGLLSGLDVASMQASMQSARADVANYTTALAQSRNALELVVGAAPGEDLLPSTGQASNKAAVALAPLPARLSSLILLQRPDVLYAEHSLKAANADIGAARAAFFPTISLTAAGGSSSDALSGLFGAETRTWSFSPSISIPIFQAGALRASLDYATLQREVTVAQYEKAIQSAFREVADALTERANIDEQLDAQEALEAATGRSYTLSELRYRNGMDSHLESLDAQRTHYSAQQSLITLRLAESMNRVTLYKVLGGGADASSSPAVVVREEH